jgi:dienelactone hydrolase
MAIRAKCDSCGHTYNIQDRFAGEELPCKHCGDYFLVPEPGRQKTRRSRDDFRDQDRSSRTRHHSSDDRPWALAIGIIAVTVIGCGLLAWSIASKSKDPNGPNDPASQVASADELFAVASVPVPQFPPVLPPPQKHASGTDVYFVDLKHTPGNGQTPGQQMAMRVYLPAGNHAAKSLGCVLVAPAGTNLLRGNAMDADDYHAETLPYVEAGYAVVFYSIDGILNDPDTASDLEFSRAYKEFKAAHAGVVNGRNALEFVLARLPQVDPDRIYCAGHSSAGVLSLLLAEHEPRINGAIAYAAASDVELRLAEVANDPQFERLLPDVKSFLKQSSPKTHTKHFECPVFLFHALDDSNEPAQTSEAFAAKLRAEGKTVTYQTAPFGDHYDSMINAGIPGAIAWLKTLPTEQGKSYPAPEAKQQAADNADGPGRGIPQRVPAFDPNVFQPGLFPPVMPIHPGQRIVVFDLESYSGQGDAVETARRVLIRFPFCDPHSVQVDWNAKTLTVGLRGLSVNTGPIKSALERAGFQLGGVTVTTQTR